MNACDEPAPHQLACRWACAGWMHTRAGPPAVPLRDVYVYRPMMGCYQQQLRARYWVAVAADP
jgi:hypothetical protein